MTTPTLEQFVTDAPEELLLPLAELLEWATTGVIETTCALKPPQYPGDLRATELLYRKIAAQLRARIEASSADHRE